LEPVVVLKVIDSSGKVLYPPPGAPPKSTRALADPSLTYLITHILADDEARAPTFGRSSPLRLSRPSAAKTGTTDDYRDSWAVGYSPDLIAGVWVGNSDGAPMRDLLSAQGAGLIYNTFMERALAGTPPRPFARPPVVIERQVCALSGLLPTPDCPQKINELFAPSNLPTRPDDLFKRADICLINGTLANDLVPPNARETRVFLTLPDTYKDWGPRLGYAPLPTARCDDIYRGVKRAEFVAPAPSSPIRGTVQVVGTALMDDLHHYDLEFGEGPSPAAWGGITMGRQQGVDNALLGVWDTASLKSGAYTLRLTLYDSVGNRHEGRTMLAVAASETPTPTAAPTGAATPTAVATPGASRTPTSAGSPPRGTPAPTAVPRRSG
jgi:membrane peptidoglycan carboxypeptidase